MSGVKEPNLLFEIDKLKKRINFLEQENINLNRKLREIERNSKVLVKNPRNAVRRYKLNGEEQKKVVSLYLDGLSIRQIASEMKCSVGLVHKILSD